MSIEKILEISNECAHHFADFIFSFSVLGILLSPVPLFIYFGYKVYTKFAELYCKIINKVP